MRHGLKVWLFGMACMLPLLLAMHYLPRWVFMVVFFAFGVFVFIPVVFAVGPIGRFIGKNLNEVAAQEAKKNRETRS